MDLQREKMALTDEAEQIRKILSAILNNWSCPGAYSLPLCPVPCILPSFHVYQNLFQRQATVSMQRCQCRTSALCSSRRCRIHRRIKPSYRKKYDP